jgi:hypothetical protein
VIVEWGRASASNASTIQQAGTPAATGPNA